MTPDTRLNESAAVLTSAAADRLVARVGHWTPARWMRPAQDNELTRSDLVFDLVQRLADLGAAAEGRGRLTVPRLPNVLALVDQVRVMVADLLAADASEDTLREAAEAIDMTLRAL